MLKKVVVGALAACLVASSASVVSAGTGTPGFTHRDSFPIVSDISTNSWIPVYSEKYNVGPALDTRTLREAAADDRWLNNEVLGATWQPTYHPDDTSNSKFLVSGNGIIQPDTGKTAGLVWKAPKTGTYYVNVTITAGEFSNEGVTVLGNGDGMTASIFKGQTNIFSRAFDKYKETVAVPTLLVTLAEGESLYFTADPKISGDHDTSLWDIQIYGAEIWHVGDDIVAPDRTASAHAQVVNGWYYMSSPKFNQGDQFDVISASKCEYIDGRWVPVDRLSESPYFQNDGNENNMAANRLDYTYGSRFALDNTGLATPGGDQTAILAWQAPVDGYYEVNANVYVGNGGTLIDTDGDGKGDRDLDGDGVTVSVYNAYTRIASENIKNGAANLVDDLFFFKAGQIIYFISDQNATEIDDFVKWDVLINFSTPDPMNYIFVVPNNYTAPSAIGSDGLYHSYDGTGIVNGGVNSGYNLIGGTPLYPAGTAALVSSAKPATVVRTDFLLDIYHIDETVVVPVSIVTPTQAGNNATVTASMLNVRSSASTANSPIGQLSQGTVVTTLGTSGNWTMISYGDGTAYVWTKYLQF